MSPRELVLHAFEHKESGRVPIDFGGHRSSGIMAQAYIRLRKQLGLPPSPVYIYDLIQQLAIPEDDLLDIVGSDVVELGHGYAHVPEYWQDWELPDGTPCKIPAFVEIERTPRGWVVRGDEGQGICIQANGSLYFEQTYFPLLNSSDETYENLEYDLNQIMWWRIGSPPAPAGLDEEGRRIRRESAKSLRNATDRAIYGAFGGNLLETGTFAFRNDEFLYLLAAEPDRMHRFLDKLLAMHLENLECYIEAVGDQIDIIGFGDDLGMQAGPTISPAMYRKFFKPRHAAMWKRVKELAPHLKVSLHCCGGVYPLLADLIEAGLEAINPVQITCADMEPAQLKREFGRDLVFWGGGCDTREILPRGTPQQVRAHVARQLDVFTVGGGYVFQQVHNVQADVPAENLVAMFETVRAYR